MQNLSNPRKEAAAGKIVHTKKNKHDEGKTTRMNENTECKRGKSVGTRDPFYIPPGVGGRIALDSFFANGMRRGSDLGAKH